MLFMPIIVWIARGPMIRLALSLAACLVFLPTHPDLGFGMTFGLGAVMYRLDVQCKLLQRAIPQWLGRISYSLYLSHWLVLTVAWRAFGPEIGGAISFPIALAVGWLVWWTVERPSTRASQRIPTFNFSPRWQPSSTA